MPSSFFEYLVLVDMLDAYAVQAEPTFTVANELNLILAGCGPFEIDPSEFGALIKIRELIPLLKKFENDIRTARRQAEKILKESEQKIIPDPSPN
jgi:hypothetical protein